MTNDSKKFEDVDLASLGSDSDSDIEGSLDGTSDNQADKIKAQLAKRETAQVFRLRLLVFFVLALAAGAVSAVVYMVTSSSEKDEYRTQYDGASKLVLDTFIDIVEAKLAVVSSLAVALIAHGVDHTGSWPYVTISSFQQRASTARSQSGSLYVQVNPLVEQEQREAWEMYAVGDDSDWIRRDLAYQREIGLFDFLEDTSVTIQEGIDANEDISDSSPWPIWFRNEQDQVVTDLGAGPYLPTWQTSPVFYDGRESNENILRSFRTSSKAANESYYNASVVLGEFLTASPGDVSDSDPYTALYALLLSTFRQTTVDYEGDPISQVFFPIFDGFTEDRKPVGIMTAWVHWKSYFERILPDSLRGVMLVLNDSCGHVFTFQLNGESIDFLGEGDLHDHSYNHLKRTASFEEVTTIADGTRNGLPLNHDRCLVFAEVYPSNTFYDIFNSSTPALMTCAVAIIFIFTAFMFVFYDRLVERRQALVMKKAVETTAVVASLFPEAVRDRLIQGTTAANDSGKNGGFMNQNNRLKGFINDGGKDDDGLQPIAELYPRCTVLFSDLAGFTAWSSSREPAQVFILLQTVYQAFDIIAKRRKVFKVETIGDSYLAVTGLPEPMENHHSVMIRFAWDCMLKLNEITKELEISLGPDTGDLTMRFGVHSGPVTAGVLRGERARFQLFGDTVNTASRMESTGQKGKIQASSSTATLLQEAGKGHWLRPRTDQVKAKGKGVMKTFWVNPTNRKSSTGGSTIGTTEAEEEDDAAKPELVGDNVVKPLNQRLVAWMTDLLLEDIKKVVYSHKLLGVQEEEGGNVTWFRPEGATYLDEVQEKITMPVYNAKVAENMEGYNEVEIPPVVLEELQAYVTAIASMYRSNPFHNFEHACHVSMSVKKLLKRIVTPDLSAEELEELAKGNKHLASHLHEYTHGLNSDPLVTLAITISALIHDVDHRGVSNMQLAKEEPAMADKFQMKSIAEQNSIEIAWNYFMEPRFERLRTCLFKSKKELFRFRQLIVNVVLATDIFDKELNDLRKNRWTQAFGNKENEAENKDSDLRATIVIEHIIQASDVSHTMQHWQVYQKWNKCLFKEMQRAFKAGRLAKDPAEFWYKGEIGFFDNYVIPLARKLQDCNVFGVSSEEYLNYAIQNREEWAERGEDLVRELVEEGKGK